MNALAMDTTRLAGRLRGLAKEQWLKTAYRHAPLVVTGVLVLIVAHQLATLVWVAVPGAPVEGPPPVVAATSSGSDATTRLTDWSTLTGSHLFGKTDTTRPTPTVITAPETTLSLKLTGVVAERDPADGQAIIASTRNQERKYTVGQAINGAGGATVQSVYADRVILKRDGRLETLRLPKESSSTAPRRTQVAVRPSPPRDSLRETISQNASKITQVLRVAPQLEGGKMVGFRLNPGRDTKTFEALGLEPGDVVTNINGTVLDDPAKGLQVFQSLGEASQATVTVLRNGAPTVLVIDTSQLQNLGGNRE